jgi:hypothetical protein
MRLPSIRRSEWLMLLLDMAMLVLVLVNLGLILFDGLFSSHFVQEFFARNTPGFHALYLPVHRNFSFYDAWFVGVFIAELLLRWAVAAWKRTYHKWWFYPFVHWYDTLGCIPVGSFRFLRVLRIVSILMRLQRNRLVDLRKTYVYRQFNKYSKVVVEELSDRVVLNVLDGLRDEVRKGSPIADRILTDIVQPHRGQLSEWLSDRIQASLGSHYGIYRPELREYLDAKIRDAVQANQELSTLDAIPLLGREIRLTLERAVADIVFRVVDGMVEDAASPSNKVLIDELSGIAFDALLYEERNSRLEKAVRSMVTQSLDLIAAEVKVQQWKLREEQEDAIRNRAKRIAAIRKSKKTAAASG